MALSRRLPATDILSMRDMFDRFFDDNFYRMTPWENSAFTTRNIPLDISEKDDQVLVKASIPGIKPEELHVEVDDEVLRIWGDVKDETEQKEEDYYLREHHYGRIERMASLPYPVMAEKAKAEFKDGILNLSLPKAAESRRKEIKIKVNN